MSNEIFMFPVIDGQRDFVDYRRPQFMGRSEHFGNYEDMLAENTRNRCNPIIVSDLQYGFIIPGVRNGFRVTPALRRMVRMNFLWRALPQIDSVEFWESANGTPLPVGRHFNWNKVRTGKVRFSKKVLATAKQWGFSLAEFRDEVCHWLKYDKGADSTVYITGQAFDARWLTQYWNAFLIGPRWREADAKATTMFGGGFNTGMIFLSQEHLNDADDEWELVFDSPSPRIIRLQPPAPQNIWLKGQNQMTEEFRPFELSKLPNLQANPNAPHYYFKGQNWVYEESQLDQNVPLTPKPADLLLEKWLAFWSEAPDVTSLGFWDRSDGSPVQEVTEISADHYKSGSIKPSLGVMRILTECGLPEDKFPMQIAFQFGFIEIEKYISLVPARSGPNVISSFVTDGGDPDQPLWNEYQKLDGLGSRQMWPKLIFIDVQPDGFPTSGELSLPIPNADDLASKLFKFEQRLLTAGKPDSKE